MLSLPGPLVSVDWLAAHLTHPGLRIADVRWSLSGPPGRERYADGHVRGAVFLDAERELSSPGEGPGRHPVPSAAKLAAILGRAGIGDDHVVVAYDDAGGSIAARLWWLYRHFGHDGDCAVLDGGISAWTDAGRGLTTDVPAHPAATTKSQGRRCDGGAKRHAAVDLAIRPGSGVPCPQRHPLPPDTTPQDDGLAQDRPARGACLCHTLGPGRRPPPRGDDPVAERTRQGSFAAER